MSETKRKVPKLRFPGFTEDWEQRKLREILKVNSGKDYKHLEIGDIPVYGTGGYMLSVNEALSEVDAIGIGRKGTIDKPQYLKAPFWTVDTLFYLVPLEEYSCSLLYHLSNLIPWKKFDESTGVPSLSKSTIDGIQVNIPKDKKEQDRISKLFDRINNLITLHQRKLENLKLKKKALLQKLFPKNGEQFPELRFPGFTDAWEQRKLGEIGVWSKGTGGNKEIINFDRRGIKFIHYADLYKANEFFEKVEGWVDDESIGTIVPSNSILFPMSDVTPKGLARTTSCKLEGVKAGGDVLINTIDDTSDSDYISLYINRFSDRILPLVTGTSVKHINAKSLGELPVLIPTLLEQRKIISILKKHTILITLHQRKLEHLQLQKKALLQQMFV